MLYDGWILYSRWQEVRRARQTLELIGGTDFRIINFYADPQAIPRGEQTKICFGVYGAKRVRVEPAVGDLHPTISDDKLLSAGCASERH